MRKLLIVEDSPTEQVRLCHVLEAAGHRVHAASSAEQALRFLGQESVDLVLSDVVMPGMDGYQLCAALKERSDGWRLPVILLTALSNPQDVVRALEVKADGFISKPCDDAYLVQKIQHTLESPPCRADSADLAPIEITYANVTTQLSVSREQVIRLLLSTYENSVRQNQELMATQLALKHLNLELVERLRELQLSETRFSTLVGTIPDIVYKVNPAGQFTFINDAIRQWGYEPAELIGTHFSRLIHPDELDRVSRERVLHSAAGEPAGPVAPKLFDERRTGARMTTGLEVTLLAKSGALLSGHLDMLGHAQVHTEVNSSGLYEESGGAEKTFVGSVGVIRDITERKRVEDKVLRLATFAEHNPNPVLELNLKGTVTYANPAAQSHFPGILQAGAEHPLVEWLSGVFADPGGVGENFRHVVDWKAGVYEISANRVPGKALIQMQVFDITDRKRHEAELREHQAMLESRVAQRTRELTESKCKLEEAVSELYRMQDQLLQTEKLKAVSTMVAGVAHELNNPLTGILNYVQYAQKRVADPKVIEVLDKAHETTRRTAKIIQNMLAHGRLEEADEYSEISVAEIFQRELLAELEAVRGVGIGVELALQEESVSVSVNRETLILVLINLLHNARDAVESSAQRQIFISSQVNQNDLCIEVADTGPGIPESLLKKIFDPFFTTKPPGKGTGLGLSICLRILSHAGGRLVVENRAGGGAKFLVVLPVRERRDFRSEAKVCSQTLSGKPAGVD